MIVGNQLAPATEHQKAYLRSLMRQCRRSSEEIQAMMNGRLTQSIASHQIKRFSAIAEYYRIERLANMPGVPAEINRRTLDKIEETRRDITKKFGKDAF